MDLKYSVIIPVYNAESTLDRCLNSLVCQLNENIEIILIDDGSTDDSYSICQSYASRYPNISVIKQMNGGVSKARNHGLDEAKGDYILFVDSDDYVAANYFEAISTELDKTKCDMYQFSYTIISSKGEHTRTFKPLVDSSRELLIPDIIKAMCNKRINQPWAKVYKRSLIETNNIRFAEGASIAEDREFNIRYSLYINSYCASDTAVYYVDRRNENSLSRKKQMNAEKQAMITHRYFEESIENAPIPLNEKALYIKADNFSTCRSIYHEAKKLHYQNIGWWGRQKKLKNICQDINDRRMEYPNTLFCNALVLPVRLKLTVIIDCLAWKLIH